MKPGALYFRFVSQLVYKAIAISCALLLALVPDYPIAWSQQPQPAQPAPSASPQTAPTVEALKIPPEQLDSLVAPIALYPDPLLGQTLVASTYPLEIVQLWQWMQKNTNLKDKALEEAVQQQNWDPSIQGLAAIPDVVQRMADNIAWTMDLGNAFLAQQSDVMDAVQRMRAKAQGTGNLKPTPQQNVSTQTVEGGKQVIVIEQSQPDVVYVPSYDSTVVYGAPPVAYPYPAYAYPGYVPGMMLSFGVGIAMGAAWGGGWGYGCGWGGNDIDVNFNNSFNNRDRQQNANRGQGGNRGGGGNKWQHRPEHRGGAPYGDRRTADKFGGRTSGQRPTAGQRPSGGAGAGQRAGGGAGAGTRSGGGLSASQRPSGGAGAGNRGSRPSASQRPSGGSSNRVGNRSVSSGSGGSRDSGFGSSNNTFGGGGYDGRSARSSSSRGSSSMGSGGFGGGSRGGYSGGSRGGGGGRGGGGRGGGGGRRR